MTNGSGLCINTCNSQGGHTCESQYVGLYCDSAIPAEPLSVTVLPKNEDHSAGCGEGEGRRFGSRGGEAAGGGKIHSLRRL